MEVIKVEARIKDCKITDECGKLNFNGCDFSPDQYKMIAKIVKTGEKVNLIIQRVQEQLFEDPETENAAGTIFNLKNNYGKLSTGKCKDGG